MMIRRMLGLLAFGIFLTATAAEPAERPAELWRWYMHGITDDKATPVRLDAIPELAPLLDSKTRLDTPFKKSGEAAVKLMKPKEVTFPLLTDCKAVRGKKIRIFFWLKGFKVGYKDGWHAPNIVVIPRDRDGRSLYAYDSGFHTEGTYPWHCYYVDRFIPKETESLWLKLYTPNGVAHFTGIGWEPVGPENTYDANFEQDPHSGSLAPNVCYDQMPEHMTQGQGTKYPWEWLRGGKIGLIGQPDDVTTKAGFRDYYFNMAKKRPEHMNHAILYMGGMFRSGQEQKLLPPMEDGWLENFAQILMADQDPATGYWHDGKALSLGLTFHLCNMHFRRYELQRSDREDISSSLALVDYVPRAREMILQTLKQQSTWTAPDGVTRPAAWSRAAYRYTLKPDDSKDKCYLGSTWDAIYLLRLASRCVDDPALKAQVYDSVKNAMFYMLHKNVTDDGQWLSSDLDDHPSNPSYIVNIMQDVHYLERKIDPAMPTPEVSCRPSASGGTEFSGKVPAGADSIRIYIADSGIPAGKIDETSLAGVIQRTGHKFYEMDPFVGCDKTRHALNRRFGTSLELPPESDWRGKRYLPWKFRKLKLPLPFTTDNQPLTLPAKLDGKAVYISSCNWYGEESPLVPLSVSTP